jgi:GPI mannosyltransferase 3
MLRRVVLLAILSTAARVWLAHHYDGFETGDDVEIAQEAFRAAFGSDYEPWGIRSLFVSQALVAPLLRVAAAFGMDDAFSLAAVARYPFILFAGLNVILVYLLGRRWFSEEAGALAAALYSIHWLPLVFGSSLYPRIPGTTFLLLAALVATNARFFAAGVLASLAFTMRYSEIAFLPGVVWASGLPLVLSDLPSGLLTTAVPRDRWRVARALRTLAGFVAGVLLFVGLYDWLSWGSPFASLIEFARYTLVERESSSLMKEQPAWWYLAALPQWLAPPLWLFLWRERRKALVWIAIPLVALSVVHHKELRYLQAVIPFAMILAAAGAVFWWQTGRRKLVIVLLVLALPLQLARIRSIEKRTMAAVDAARSMRNANSVALSQEWAYGGRLFLRNVEELGIPPDLVRLREAAPRVDCVAMYRSQITPETRAIVSAAGLTAARGFERARSRPVDVFCR